MRLLAAIVLGFVIGLVACGDTLVDHRNAKVRDQQQPATCNAGTATCAVDNGIQCLSDTVTQCGATCANCAATVTPPSGGQAACRPPAEDPPVSQSTCGWECTGGLLKSGNACSAATALAAGAAHTCAVTSDQRLLCWGKNDEGQVTGTASTPVLTPHEVFASGVTAVAAGTAHTCATVAGQVRCIGRNADGQAPATRAVNAAALAAGDRHTCALDGSGAVTCWGALNVGQTGGGTPIASGASALATGADHTCALLGGTGEVRCWGTNASGELGNGTPGGFFAAPQTPVGLGTGIVAIGAGAHHTCAATGTRTTPVRCWGANPAGPDSSVLPGLPDPEPTPTEPQKPSGGGGPVVNFDVAALAGGRAHTCVQRDSEPLKCFGADNSAGQLGIGLPGELADPGAPIPAVGATSVFAVGGDHGCVVAQAGTVACWGSNAFGQLGDDTTITPTAGKQVPVSGR